VLALLAYSVVWPDAFASAKSNLSTYANEAYGISFNYPTDFVLKGPETKLTLGYLGTVEDDPRWPRIAALLLPDDNRPSKRGIYQLSTYMIVRVDRVSPKSDCSIFYYGGELVGRVKVGTTAFVKAEGGSAGMCHQNSYDLYRVFRNKAWYEFEIGQVTSCEMTKDQEHAEDVLLKELKRILATVAFRPPKSRHRKTSAALQGGAVMRATILLTANPRARRFPQAQFLNAPIASGQAIG